MTVLAHRCLLRLAALGLAGLLCGCASAPGSTPGHSGKAELATASDQTAAQKRAEIRMQLAIGYYQQGQYAVALDEIKKALAADPELADAYSMRALTYMAMDERELAEDNFVRALKLAPNSPEVNNNYGSFLCRHGRVAESFKYFDAALAVRSYQSPADAYNNAGSCALKQKDYDTAEKYLLPALKIAPDVPATSANLARIYYERRDYVRAGFFITRLSKLAKMDSLSADVLWLAIRVQHKLGDTGAESAWVTQLRRHHSGSPEYAAYQRGAFDE
ncbi:pilus assembly protein PilF [Massilia sp. Root351]|jgi:type IV pilus assembly protein PilF|uniref:type IV pilus biogenesis/stability protein PilW n=1 Tax=Massilia sp. Root351 TaxID=1736522 RepID=UPI00070BE29A|nr:type IV pilus biogenesis/stability protein PilW [Massilia sp. Root351]KQV85100.1 pilus assembly protein PilF [Massilia sp. Root351]